MFCSDNYLGPLGAGVLANAMRQNTGLRELFVKGNELGDEGIKSLCSAFAAREAPISVLDLGNNKWAPAAIALPSAVPLVFTNCQGLGTTAGRMQ